MIFNFLILPVAASFIWISNQNLQASLFVEIQSHVSGCLLKKFSRGNTWTSISVYSRTNLSSSPYSTLLSPPHSAEQTPLHAFALSEHGTILQLNTPGVTLAMVQLPTSWVPNTHLVSKAWMFSIRNISPVIPVLLFPLLPVPSWTVVSSLACWTLPPAPAVHPPHGYVWINLRHKLNMQHSWLRLSNVSHQLESQLLTWYLMPKKVCTPFPSGLISTHLPHTFWLLLPKASQWLDITRMLFRNAKLPLRGLGPTNILLLKLSFSTKTMIPEGKFLPVIAASRLAMYLL